MTSRIELTFLYQTRTILRQSKRIPTASRTGRRHLSQAQTEHPPSDVLENGISPTPHPSESFLKEKARRIAEASVAPKSLPKTVGTAINSTITASERRAFETILRFQPKQAEPAGIKDQSPFIDAVDTDVENILALFASSIQSYHAERDALLTKDQDQDQEQVSRSDDSLKPARHSTAGTTATDNLPEIAFAEIAAAKRFERFDFTIQRAVRERMKSISDALIDAATSTTSTTRGDIAMWQICESQIFSLAGHLQPPSTTAATHRFVGPDVFKFSRAHSDNPPEMIEAAERELLASIPVNPESTVTTDSLPATHASLSPSQSQSWTSLTILHHVYPASLLLALRLFTKHFPSSPFAHNLLPRIRSLGHTSYVLGASTQFYNSLLSLVWLARSSLREIDGLLSEMERGGVEHNEETYRILRHIERERAKDLKTAEGQATQVKEGCRGAGWWKRHEQIFWFPRVLEWEEVIAGRLDAKERMLEEERREYFSRGDAMKTASL